MKWKLQGNILAFLIHLSVTIVLRTCGRKLANEPKSYRNITDLASSDQYTRRTGVKFESKLIPPTLSWPKIDSFDTCKQIKRSFKWNNVIWYAVNRAIFRKEIYPPSRELKISAFFDNLSEPPLEIMKEETSMNVWKESFLIKIRFLTRNDDLRLRKVAGNLTWRETGPHTVPSFVKTKKHWPLEFGM